MAKPLLVGLIFSAMKKLLLIVLCFFWIGFLNAQSTGGRETVSLTEKEMQQHKAKAAAIDKLVQAIEANRDTYTEKVQGQVKDTTGEAIGSYELFFNYDKKTRKLLSLVRMERSATEWHLLQCYFQEGKVIRIDLNGMSEGDNGAGGPSRLYYDQGVLLPLDGETTEAEGKALLNLSQELLDQRHKQ